MKNSINKNTLLLFIGLFHFTSFSSFSQKTIQGIVIDEQTKLPISLVKVSIKDFNTETYTDSLGNFSIQVKSHHQVLKFELDQYLSKEFVVTNEKSVTIELSKNTELLEIIEIMDFEEDVDVVFDESPAESFDLIYSPKNISLSNRIAGIEIYGNSTTHNESYAKINENTFQKVSKSPLSTFSVDVDRASYSNIRRNLNNSGLPPKEAIRIEEMINYFDYDYPQPKGEIPFSINHELSNCPWNDNNLLLKIGLQGKKMERDELPKSNIVFLIDVSGSMSNYNKLPLLKSSLKILLNNLSEDDRVAIVVYAGNSGLKLESTKCSHKNKIIEALENLNASGSTAGGEGLKLAYKIAKENFIKNGNNRIVLATDGDFNVGPSSNQAMEELITENRDKGIAISVLGFGMGNYKDDKMEIIADKGNGNYAYIDNLQEAQKVLVKEFGGTLVTIAKDVKFQLEFNPKYVYKYRLIGYENRLLKDEDFDNDKKDAGEIGAGHSVTALYEIVPSSSQNNDNNNLKYQTSELTNHAQQSNDLVTLKLRYKEPKMNKSNLIEVVVSNEIVSFSNVSKDFKFTTSIAEFGMMLKDSQFKGNTTWNSVIQLAKEGKGEDEDGYKVEMIRLVKVAQSLSMSHEN